MNKRNKIKNNLLDAKMQKQKEASVEIMDASAGFKTRVFDLWFEVTTREEIKHVNP